MTRPVISANGVTVEHDGTTLLGPTTFDLAAGECLILRGKNGAGKTTLLRVLAGLIPPSGGTVLAWGHAPDDRSRDFRARVSAMLGPAAAYPDLTVRDNLAVLARLWRCDAALGILDELGIPHLGSRFLHELSSGQRQMVTIAFALARPAELLILDEPEQRLDAEHRAVVAAALARRARVGATLVIATHDADMLSALHPASLELFHPAADER